MQIKIIREKIENTILHTRSVDYAHIEHVEDHKHFETRTSMIEGEAIRYMNGIGLVGISSSLWPKANNKSYL